MTNATPTPIVRRLERGDGPVGGVAAGLADYFNVDPTLIRLGLVATTFIGGPVIPICYLAAWVIIPRSGDVPIVPLPGPVPTPPPPPAPPAPSAPGAPTPSPFAEAPGTEAPADVDPDPDPEVDSDVDPDGEETGREADDREMNADDTEVTS